MPQGTPLVLTIGGFDGLHLGHQEIIRRVREIARALNGISGMVTFHPLPAQLLHPDFPYLLTPLPEKIPLLTELGVEFTYCIEFDERLRETEPEPFIENHILNPLKPRALVVGADHRFGQGGKGNTLLLKEIANARGITLEIVPQFVHLGAPVKSTRIREHLLLGHVGFAAELLGRPYTFTGRVIPGTGTGRRLGFPTLNLQPVYPEKLVPAEGVYAVIAETPAGNHPGVLNIGFCPTFRRGIRTIELHLLDYPQNAPQLTTLTVHFLKYLRPETRFSCPEALQAQVREDIAAARKVIAESPYRRHLLP